MFCFKCGKQIVDDSIYCSYCGIKLSLSVSSNRKNAENNINYDEIIINACKDYIKTQLQCPGTANFNYVEIKEKDNAGRVYLTAEVDAQNNYGAMKRGNYRVILQKVNKDGTYVAKRGGFDLVSKNDKHFKIINDFGLPMF